MMPDRDSNSADALILDFPFPRESYMAPPPLYADLRCSRPVVEVTLQNGTNAYLVTRYEDVRTVLRDRGFSRPQLSKTEIDELVAATPSPIERDERVTTDHAIPWNIVRHRFSPDEMEKLKPRAQAIAMQLLDQVIELGPPCDLIDSFARPFPAMVACGLLGIPEKDCGRISELVPLTLVEEPTIESKAAVKELSKYFARLLATKRDDRASDLLSVMVDAHNRSPDVLPEAKLLRLVIGICAGAIHTITVTLGKGIPILLAQPAIFAAIHNNTANLPAVVEEVLRTTSPAVTALPRIALVDTELSGIRIRPGSIVLACVESANYDDIRYPQPQQICPERGDGQHLTFGLGANFCIGSALARMEVQVAVSCLARRLPTLELTTAANQLQFRPGRFLAHDVLELPVRW
jgi:pentalenic acid synthase